MVVDLPSAKHVVDQKECARTHKDSFVEWLLLLFFLLQLLIPIVMNQAHMLNACDKLHTHKPCKVPIT